MVEHPGLQLRAFRVARGLSLRESARQLHVKHPALKDWEDGVQTPAPAYRDAIEVWTRGDIRADAWPVSTREREIIERASQVRPVESSTNLISDVEHRAAS